MSPTGTGPPLLGLRPTMLVCAALVPVLAAGFAWVSPLRRVADEPPPVEPVAA